MWAFPLSPTTSGVWEPWGCRALGGHCGKLGPRDGQDLPNGKLPGAQTRSRPWCQPRATSLHHPGPTVGTEPEARPVALSGHVLRDTVQLDPGSRAQALIDPLTLLRNRSRPFFLLFFFTSF